MTPAEFAKLRKSDSWKGQLSRLAPRKSDPFDLPERAKVSLPNAPTEAQTRDRRDRAAREAVFALFVSEGGAASERPSGGDPMKRGGLQKADK